jgi:hypothetical protein
MQGIDTPRRGVHVSNVRTASKDSRAVSALGVERVAEAVA